MRFVRILFLFSLLTAQPTLAKDVFVHGYMRSNGTYVAPHYRSAPDGNVLNNWSTRGNMNPYTGQMGTRLYGSGRPGALTMPPELSNYDSAPSPLPMSAPSYQPTRSSFGTVPFNTGDPLSTLSSLDEPSRMAVASRLTQMGYNVDWRKHSLSQMTDLETRIGISNRLQSMGENIPWQHRNLSELLDIQSRVETARRLQQSGQTVDWKSHSLGELLNLEAVSKL